MTTFQRLMLVLLAAHLITHAAAQQAKDTAPVTLPDGVRIPVLLKTSINTKSAKPGMPIVLEATSDVRSEREALLIPKGARITGRVTVAVPWTKQNKESRFSLVAERAEWKEGHAVLKAFIVGHLRVLNSALVSTGLSDALSGAEVLQGGSPAGPQNPYKDRAVDKSAHLRAAADPTIASEVFSTERTVQMDAGSTFVLRHSPNQ